MWIFVAILIVIVLYLIVLASGRAEKLQNEKSKVDDEIEKLSKNYQEQIQTATHNNIVLLEKNKKLTMLKLEIESIVFGKRTAEEKIEKIELLFSGKNNNQN